MKLRDWFLVLVGCAAMSGFLWQFYERGRWQVRAQNLEAHADSTDKIIKHYVQDSIARAKVMVVLDKKMKALKEDSIALAAAYAQARDSMQKTEDRLDSLRRAVQEETLPLVVRQLLQGERVARFAAQDAERACSVALRNAEARGKTCGEQRDSLKAEVADLQKINGRLKGERDSARALMKPPPLLNLTLELSAGGGCVLLPIGGGNPVCGASVQGTLLRFRLPLLK